MGSIWLYDLPDVVDAAGLEVRVWHGWETRARSSGGLDGLWAVFCHHTASTTDPDSDCAWEWDYADDRPIGNMHLDRDGRVTIGAAGAANTQGKGGPWQTSSGTIPLDKGNCYGIAIEAANAGTGEPWPAAQTSAYVELVAALADWYGLDVTRDCFSHALWCEPSCAGRKIDPAGPSPWAQGSATWDWDAFRASAAACLEEDNMALSADDIDRIAAATVDRLLAASTTDPTVDKPVTVEQLWQYTRHAAANADIQTRPDD